MKIFTKKGITQKITIVLVILVLFNFILPTTASRAKDDMGGVLFSPIRSLLIGIANVGETILGKVVYGTSSGNAVFVLFGGTSYDTVQGYEYTSGGVQHVTGADSLLKDSDGTEYALRGTLRLPNFSVTLQDIFANKVPLLDVNFINPNKSYKDPTGANVDSIANSFRGVIAKWYVALRNLAIVGLLCVLVYVGIRIMLSSTAGDKAKYKQMFMDWVVALCLIFFLHYIMSFALTITESVTELLLGNMKDENGIIVETMDLKAHAIDGDKLKQKVSEFNGETYDISNILWKTDLTGDAMIRAQASYFDENDDSNTVAMQFGYTVIYLVLVMYTFMYFFKYLMRLLNILFLTLMAPLVALTYPIDKINDGKAQAFNTWIKEYVFNLLLQPMHLILYMVLLGTTMELATKHPIYALAVLGFMLPGEKILRKMFGFEKASMIGSIAGSALGGAMVMTGLNQAVSAIKKSGAKGKASKGTDSDGKQPRMKNGEGRSSEFSADEEDDFLRKGLGGSESDGDGIGGSESDGAGIGGDTDSSDNDLYQKYSDDGFGKNAFGEYFNPYTDEYDPDYDPSKDPMYMSDGDSEIDDESISDSDTEEPVDTEPHYLRGAVTLLKDNAPTVLKGAIKGIGMAYGAATLGTLGIAAGLASDNYGNVGKWGLTGAAGGAVVGNVAAQKAIELPSDAYRKVQNARDALEKASRTPEGYEKYQNEKSDRAFLASKEMQELYKKKFGEEKYKKAMQAAITYRKHGIEDNDLIIKTMKVKGKGINNQPYDSDQRVIAARLAQQVSNEKDIEPITKRLKQKGIQDAKIQEQAEIIRKIRGLI